MSSTTCPQCGMESHNPNDVLEKYCGNCHQFYSAMKHQDPIHFNAIMAALQAPLKSQLNSGSPFSLQFEQFTEGGRRYWRALIKVGQGTWKYSRRPQLTPTDALRELSEIMDAEHGNKVA